MRCSRRNPATERDPAGARDRASRLEPDHVLAASACVPGRFIGAIANPWPVNAVASPILSRASKARRASDPLEPGTPPRSGPRVLPTTACRLHATPSRRDGYSTFERSNATVGRRASHPPRPGPAARGQISLATERPAALIWARRSGLRELSSAASARTAPRIASGAILTDAFGPSPGYVIVSRR
jgi:hypothetical protein